MAKNPGEGDTEALARYGIVPYDFTHPGDVLQYFSNRHVQLRKGPLRQCHAVESFLDQLGQKAASLDGAVDRIRQIRDAASAILLEFDESPDRSDD